MPDPLDPIDLARSLTSGPAQTEEQVAQRLVDWMHRVTALANPTWSPEMKEEWIMRWLDEQLRRASVRRSGDCDL